MKNWTVALSLFAVLGLSVTDVTPPSMAQNADKVTIIVKDGPFTSNSSQQLQRFNSAINLTPEQLSGPLTLKFYNGPNGNKFGWVRVFFNPGRSSASATAQPSGLLIIDEKSFKNTDVVQLDMSGRLAARNLLMIQGAGPPGAEVAYEVMSTEVKGVKISAVDPQEVASGGVLTVKGLGFDPETAGNKVKIDNKPVAVSKATPSELEVTVPKSLQPYAYSVEVTAHGVKSNAMQFRVVGPPELGGCSGYGLVPGSSVQITGKNFATKADKNVVTFIADGFKKRASIVSASKDSLTITVPDFPELASKLNSGVPTPVQLSVASNGVEASSQLSLFISVRPMSN